MEKLNKSCAPLPKQIEFGHVLSSEIEDGNKQVTELLLKQMSESKSLDGGCGAAYGVWTGLSAAAKEKVKLVTDVNGQQYLEFKSMFNK